MTSPKQAARAISVIVRLIGEILSGSVDLSEPEPTPDKREVTAS